MTAEVHPTQQAITEAVDRIARTPDGAALYVYLQRRLMLVAPSPDAGALQTDHGERRFAASLIAAMHKGILESGGRTGITGSSVGRSGSEQPVVIPRSQPVRSGPERHPGGRRIGPDTRVPGYDPPGGDEA